MNEMNRCEVVDECSKADVMPCRQRECGDSNEHPEDGLEIALFWRAASAQHLQADVGIDEARSHSSAAIFCEIERGREAHPRPYARTTAFDSARGRETPPRSYPVNRPPEAPQFGSRPQAPTRHHITRSALLCTADTPESRGGG
ncbi:MAG: hypothetical protein QJR02_03635 [Sinobacteraceae bacterium]|nr:hypothetical protein [Nevskiaceae bacterium]